MPALLYPTAAKAQEREQDKVAEQTAPLTIADYPFRIVFLGDSLSYGYKIGKKHAFAGYFQRELHKRGYNYAGVAHFSSRTMTAERAYKKYLGKVLAIKPHLVIIELGASDVYRNRGPMKIRHFLNKLIRDIYKQSDTAIVLVGMPMVKDHGQDYADKYYAVYHDLVEFYDMPFYHNFLDGVLGYEERTIKGQVLPNISGMIVIAQRFTDFLVPYLPEPVESGQE